MLRQGSARVQSASSEPSGATKTSASAAAVSVSGGANRATAGEATARSSSIRLPLVLGQVSGSLPYATSRPSSILSSSVSGDRGSVWDTALS